MYFRINSAFLGQTPGLKSSEDLVGSPWPEMFPALRFSSGCFAWKGEQGETISNLSVTWTNELITRVIGNRFGLLRQLNSMQVKTMIIVIL